MAKSQSGDGEGRGGKGWLGKGSDGGYDPAQFIIPAQDSKGHSERVWVRVQIGHERQADLILRSKVFPFRTKGDLLRWCIVEGMRQLASAEQDAIPSVMGQVDMMLEILRDEMFQQDFQATFELMSRVVAKHMEMQALGEARRLVTQLKHTIQKMPDGYWRDRYAREMAEKYGHLLEGKGKGARLGKK